MSTPDELSDDDPRQTSVSVMRDGDASPPLATRVLAGWRPAMLTAAGTTVIALTFGVALVFVIGLVAGVQGTTQLLDGGALIALVLSLPLQFLGGIEDTPLLMTGVAGLALTLRLILGRIALPATAHDRAGVVTLSAQIAVITTMLLVLLGALVEAGGLTPQSQLGAPVGLGAGFEFSVGFVRLFVLTMPVVFVVSVWAVARAVGLDPAVLLRFGTRDLEPIRASAVGLGFFLRWGGGGLLALYVGSLVIALLPALLDGGLGGFIGSLLGLLLLTFLVVVVDVAALVLEMNLSFFRGESVLRGEPEWWMWLGLVGLVVLMFVAGRRATESGHVQDRRGGVLGGVGIGVLLSLLGFGLWINYGLVGGLESTFVPFVLMPLLWVAPAVAGAATADVRTRSVDTHTETLHIDVQGGSTMPALASTPKPWNVSGPERPSDTSLLPDQGSTRLPTTESSGSTPAEPDEDRTVLRPSKRAGGISRPVDVSDVLGADPLSADEIARRVSRPVDEVMGTLAAMVNRGEAAQDERGRWRRRHASGGTE